MPLLLRIHAGDALLRTAASRVFRTAFNELVSILAFNSTVEPLRGYEPESSEHIAEVAFQPLLRGEKLFP
jgi:hypothetical protein